MREKIIIEPLSEKTLANASKLTLDVFYSNVNDGDYSPRWLKASLNPEKNKKLFEDFYVKRLRYWVALNNNNVLVVIGYYTLEYDEREAYWLGWYCVDPRSRGKGIGKLLLDFIIAKTKEDGKTWLRLYTSNKPNEKRANKIYDKLGFKPIQSKKINEIANSKRFREFTKDLAYKELKLN